MQLVECIGFEQRMPDYTVLPSDRHTVGAMKSFFTYLDGFTLQDLLNKPTYDLLYEPRIPFAVQ